MEREPIKGPFIDLLFEKAGEELAQRQWPGLTGEAITEEDISRVQDYLTDSGVVNNLDEVRKTLQKSNLKVLPEQ